MTENLKVADKKVLLVLSNVDKNLYLSARNLKSAKVMSAALINTYNVLDAGVLVFTESALEQVNVI